MSRHVEEQPYASVVTYRPSGAQQCTPGTCHPQHTLTAVPSLLSPCRRNAILLALEELEVAPKVTTELSTHQPFSTGGIALGPQWLTQPWGSAAFKDFAEYRDQK